MNWISLIDEKKRAEGAQALRSAADALERGESQRVLAELAFVLGIAIGVLKNFGLDPRALLVRGVDWALAKVPEAVDKARGKKTEEP